MKINNKGPGKEKKTNGKERSKKKKKWWQTERIDLVKKKGII